MDSSEPLIVYFEDDRLSQEVMRLLLHELMGYSNFVILSSTDNYVDVLERLNKTPDIIFLDIHIQPHDGIEVAQQLRKRRVFDNTKIVATTASIDTHDIKRLRDAGFSGLVTKPINQRTFPIHLHNILNSEEVWEELP